MRDPFEISGKAFRIKNDTVSDRFKSSNDGDAWWFTSNEKGGSLRLAVDSQKLGKFLAFLFAAIFILVGRTFYLQAVRGAHYRNIAEGNRVRVKTVKANRGVIFDRNGKLLARNIPNFYLAAVPADLPAEKKERERVLAVAEEMVGEDFSLRELEEELARFSRFSHDPIMIRGHIGHEEAIRLKILADDLPGLTIEAQATRDYLAGESTAHLLGYVGKISSEEYEAGRNEGYLFTDYIGKTGLELQYENVLRGKDGKKQVEVDSRGAEKKVLGYKEPQTGENLILSLDLELQVKVKEILEKGLQKAGTKRGSAIAMDPGTGEILAMVDLPAYDNNLFSKGIDPQSYSALLSDSDLPLFFRSIAGEYPSGSTFKMIVAAAALQEGIITPFDSYMSSGGLRIGEWNFPDWLAGGHGMTGVYKALADSVNTFFYIIGGGLFDPASGTLAKAGLGVEKIVEYARMFGLSQETGVDLPGEKEGFLPGKEWKEEAKGERWYVGDTYHLAIGQGDILVTPLQVANYTSAVANGGTLYRPHLVVKTVDCEGNEARSMEPEVIREDFIDKSHVEAVREGLRQGVTSGSSRRLSLLSVSAAGKTGTAQAGDGKETHAWLASFAPYEDPEIVLVVLAENGGGGSQVAAPIAYEILKWHFEERTGTN